MVTPTPKEPTMPNNEELLKLAARCEAATGADRELDVAIEELCGEGGVGAYYGGETPEHLKQKELSWEKPYAEARRFTASLDSAMRLVPVGWVLTLTAYGDGATVALADDRVHPVRLASVEATAATPALALTAAALRARAAA